MLKGSFGEEFPAVVDEPGVGVGGELFRSTVPLVNLLAGAPPLMIVGELQPLPWQGDGKIRAGLHGGEAIVGVPFIRPATVGCQVPIGIVVEGFGGFGEEDVSGFAGGDVFAVGAGVVADAEDGDMLMDVVDSTPKSLRLLNC